MGNRIELIVGLGNPDAEHLNTRHNAGFWFVDILARTHGSVFRLENRFHGEVAEIAVDNHRIRILKPMTYMNNSGQAAKPLLSALKIFPRQVIVIHDDIDQLYYFFRQPQNIYASLLQ